MFLLCLLPGHVYVILHLSLKEEEAFQKWHLQSLSQSAGLPDAGSPAVLRARHRQPLDPRTALETLLKAERPSPACAPSKEDSCRAVWLLAEQTFQGAQLKEAWCDSLALSL